MKRTRMVLAGMMAMTLLVSFYYGPVEAQDMSMWLGKWFKVTAKSKGYSGTESGLTNDQGDSTFYWNITGWDDTRKVMLIDRYIKDPEWEIEPFEILFIAGSSLEFLCLRQETFSHDAEDPGAASYAAVIKGKQKNGDLISATIKSLGGYKAESEGGEFFRVGGLTVSGSLIPESKLPPDIPEIIGQPMAPLSFSFSPCSSGGDSITVSEVTGTSATIISGAEYEICGTYTLNSIDSARILAANYAPLGLYSSEGSPQDISKGSGSYCVSFTVKNIAAGFEKKIGIGFYAKPSGNQFFGSGYGCSDIVLE